MKKIFLCVILSISVLSLTILAAPGLQETLSSLQKACAIECQKEHSTEYCSPYLSDLDKIHKSNYFGIVYYDEYRQTLIMYAPATARIDHINAMAHACAKTIIELQEDNKLVYTGPEPN